MRRLGQEYAKECRRQYGKPLESLGYNLEGFLTNLTGLCDIIKTNSNLKTKNDVPSLVCNRQEDQIVLHFFTNREPIRYFVGGVIEGVSREIFSKSVRVTCEKCDTPNGDRSNHRFYFKYLVEDECIDTSLDTITKTTTQNGHENASHAYVSSNVRDSKISVSSFCKAFPWHFVCNKAMRITQMGSGLSQVSLSLF